MSDHEIPAGRLENTTFGPERPPVFPSFQNLITVPPVRTESELRSKDEEEHAAFLGLVRPYLETPKLAADQLSQLLIALSLAGLDERELCQCLSQLNDFVTIADALKVRFQHLPVDATRLRNLYETIVEFTQSDMNDYAKGDPQWEDRITGSVDALRHSMPALRLWVEGAGSEVDPWSRAMTKQDWVRANKKRLTTNLWRRITQIKDNRVKGGKKGRGPWRLRKSVCDEFDLVFPQNG